MFLSNPQSTRPARATASRRGRSLWLLAIGLMLSACTCSAPADQEPLLVFAASDLRDALTEITRDHRAAGGDSAVLVFGSSGELSTQIANGAPADLFFAANAEVIDALAARGSIVESSRDAYAIGRLAVIARCTRADTINTVSRHRPDRVNGANRENRANREAETETTTGGECPRITLADLVSDSLRTIAIADPSHAPYGRAAQQALERAGLWDAVRPKLVLGANISQAELFVTSGNADAGIVALSLLQRSPGRVYTIVDSSLYDPLIQTVALVARSRRQDAARALVAYMRSSAGRAVMDRYGFSPPPPRTGAAGDS